MKCYALGALLLTACLSAQGAVRDIKIFQVDSRYTYRNELLMLILDKTREQGECQLKPREDNVTQDRGLMMLKQGEVDVASLPTTPELEKTYRAVPVDILRGLLGYRVLLIRRDRLADFAAVRSLADLQQFVYGFGTHWADAELMKHNGLKIMPAAHYETLFAMLIHRRFDAFPRGLNEAWQELQDHQQDQPEMVVEPTLALYYDWPVYFFVRREDVQLAERLQLGLDRALEDGSMRRLFMRHYADMLNKAHLAQRRLFWLDNPYRPAHAVSPDTRWWLPKAGH